ncbi:uncharacterized protein FIBRA_07459 [Fibroporia radiculosa]|uniref:Major facilitator superfamily (MFS) profile domain-containing protein n=1 Tax=Fibroporia radiculosa TaxID=599839 RepID=J4H4M5_9APHY|nr:uncharacterized protein FIBRA_07459 [Fibroporia radiculosa]CCM05249.1 predicted protein [Fibroporia radiculosa]
MSELDTQVKTPSDELDIEKEAFDSQEPIVVAFDVDDPYNPKNWSRAKRWYLTFVAGVLGFNAAFASSAPSGMSSKLMEAFNISEELATLTISLFIFGYCVGPLFWGPLSEQCFQIGCALAPNATALMLFRLLGGMFAAAPMSNSGALISDM